MRRFWLPVLAGAALLIIVAIALRPTGRSRAEAHAPPIDPSYVPRIQAVFDGRCVVCHACFDSPCQLNLQSFEGLDRGANKAIVYRPSRLEAMAPTRMFQDARSTEEWQRRFDFFPVVSREGPDRLTGSLLWRLVEQRRAHPVGGAFNVDVETTCPRTSRELTRELAERPENGMPFGFPPLADDETRSISDWIRAGSGGPPPLDPAPAATRDAIARWDSFLNADDPKSRLVARYIFEHLFFAHVQFENAGGVWFRLVRSRTRAPAEVDEIVTVRPYDDPGVARPYYRFRRIAETIVLKTHVPYRLSDAKLDRLRRIFFQSDWDVSTPPSYERDVAANPFVAFEAIPARARYQFLLDDAYYHVKTFIHGPVCKGQVALNVIDEHFLIFFLSPDADPAVTDPAYLRSVASHLAVPAEGGDGVAAIYARFKLDELAYLRDQAQKLNELPGRSLHDLWDGDGTNPDAILTVYRHFDNAFVLRGAVGGIPKTAWVLDYPILERMYYDLVAGFNVFGNLVHQLSTRRYMNLLRIESEDQFLRFLPQSDRQSVRDSWYRGTGVALLVDVVDPFYGGPEPRIQLTVRERRSSPGGGEPNRSTPTPPKAELVRRMIGALPERVVGALEPIQWVDGPLEGTSLHDRFERGARSVVATPAPFVQAFPDATVLRVRGGENGGDETDLVYTVIRNRSHANIDFMFLEKDYLVPSEDTLHIVRGIAAARPNMFLEVSSGDVEGFFHDLRSLTAGEAWNRFLDRYGVRRTSARFWTTSDFFNAYLAKVDPGNAGVLDLMRYSND